MARDHGCPCILSVVDINSPTEGKLELDSDNSSRVEFREKPIMGKRRAEVAGGTSLPLGLCVVAVTNKGGDKGRCDKL